jgi:hypothetical protein
MEEVQLNLECLVFFHSEAHLRVSTSISIKLGKDLHISIFSDFDRKHSSNSVAIFVAKYTQRHSDFLAR